MMKRTAIYFLLLALLMFSCKQKKAWDNSKIENTTSSYENYLKQYSDGKFADSAKFYIEELIWENTSKENNFSAYEEYLKKYPKGRYAGNANLKIENINWQQAALSASKDTKEVILSTRSASGTLSVVPFGQGNLITIFNPEIRDGNKIEISYKLENELKDDLVLIASYTEANIAALTSSFHYKGSSYDMSEKTIMFSPRPGSWVNGKTKVSLYFVTMEELSAHNNRCQAVSNVVTLFLNY